jgi:hypothetical protein
MKVRSMTLQAQVQLCNFVRFDDETPTRAGGAE